jgi:biotin transporter BioY
MKVCSSGFLPAAMVTGALAAQGWDRKLGDRLATMTIGTALTMLIAAWWLAL